MHEQSAELRFGVPVGSMGASEWVACDTGKVHLESWSCDHKRERERGQNPDIKLRQKRFRCDGGVEKVIGVAKRRIVHGLRRFAIYSKQHIHSA